MAIANQSYLLLAAADRECDQARSNLDILGDSDSGKRQRKGQLSIDTSRLTSKRKRRTKATSTQSQQQQQEQPPTSYDKKAKSVQKSIRCSHSLPPCPPLTDSFVSIFSRDRTNTLSLGSRPASCPMCSN